MDKTKCDVCKKEKPADQVSLEPSRRTLIFGMSYGHIFYEKRCTQCEAKFVKQIDSMLKRMRRK